VIKNQGEIAVRNSRPSAEKKKRKNSAVNEKKKKTSDEGTAQIGP